MNIVLCLPAILSGRLCPAFQGAAPRLSNLSGPKSIPSRISGDEFLFVLQDIDEEQAAIFAKEIINAISKPIAIEDTEVTVGASVGIAMTNDGAVTPDELINRADSAMYRAKESGRHTAVVYSSRLALWETRRLQLRHEFLPALRTGQFELFYQPQCRLEDGHVTGAEALIRWRHPQYGLLNPSAFLQIAEESALVLELGEWIIEEACRQAQQ
ncbi:EAL domain-containing protein [Noviherbaspirillum sp. DKR-6]|uniref:EAL domain-containing protein n=1 Tax=Noviherbaspirillum pedocola TaxID=2801341 RepID=A0A934W9R8_9BURK|nr:EAL domain-containing protein [Noviherbaspirillum pedocola]